MSRDARLEALGKATELDPGFARRLRARLALPGSLLREAAPALRSGFGSRLRARLGYRRPTRPWAIALGLMLGVSGAALALEQVFSGVEPAERAPPPRPSAPAAPPGPPRPASPGEPPAEASVAGAEVSSEVSEALLDVRLSAREWRDQVFGTDLRLRYNGEGTLRGPVASPKLRWDAGSLDVDVDGSVTVETEEALFTAGEATFSVVRDALGTSLTVRRGRITLGCRGERTQTVGLGRDALCLPVRPAGLLARARALAAAGAPDEAVLQTADLGLARAEAGEVAVGELLAVRLEALLALGRRSEALDAARRYEALGGPRSERIRRVIAELEVP